MNLPSNVHSIAEARKRKNEAEETMHYSDPGNQICNTACVFCRVCTICGEPACNKVVDGRVGGDHGHVWTDDVETWARHTRPCKPITIIGGTSPGPGGVS